MLLPRPRRQLPFDGCCRDSSIQTPARHLASAAESHNERLLPPLPLLHVGGWGPSECKPKSPRSDAALDAASGCGPHAQPLPEPRLLHGIPRTRHVQRAKGPEKPKKIGARSRSCQAPSHTVGLLHLPKQACQGQSAGFRHGPTRDSNILSVRRDPSHLRKYAGLHMGCPFWQAG